MKRFIVGSSNLGWATRSLTARQTNRHGTRLRTGGRAYDTGAEFIL
jgi:hypothetical protein